MKALAALAAALLVSSPAWAGTVEIRFRNPGTTAYTALRGPWGEVPVNCPGGAICTVQVTLPPGYQTVTATATDAGGLWSVASNPLTKFVPPTPAECETIPDCPADLDRNGSVTVSDFGRFYQSFGKSWATAP